MRPVTPPHHGTALAWLALVLLSAASLLLAHRLSAGGASALVVAALVWVKAQIVARRFLALGEAAPVFQRVVQAFMAYGPLGLMLIGLWAHRMG